MTLGEKELAQENRCSNVRSEPFALAQISQETAIVKVCDYGLYRKTKWERVGIGGRGEVTIEVVRV